MFLDTVQGFPIVGAQQTPIYAANVAVDRHTIAALFANLRPLMFHMLTQSHASPFSGAAPAPAPAPTPTTPNRRKQHRGNKTVTSPSGAPGPRMDQQIRPLILAGLTTKPEHCPLYPAMSARRSCMGKSNASQRALAWPTLRMLLLHSSSTHGTKIGLWVGLLPHCVLGHTTVDFMGGTTSMSAQCAV
jgi:hypothetical protein